jgi:taurine dioxygenase
MISIQILSFFLFTSFVAANDLSVATDNTHHTLSVRAFQDSVMGAEIVGIHVDEIDDREFSIIHDALIEHKVLAIRDQRNLTVEGLREFSKKFGPLRVHMDASSHYPGYEDVNVVSNIKNSTGHYIGLHGEHVETFHSDLSWHHIPVKITALHSVVRPDGCGDTHFLNAHAAFDDLNDTIKARFAGLKALNSYLKLQGNPASNYESSWIPEEKLKASKPAEHPVFTRHAVSGKGNLYVDRSHTFQITGVDQRESDEILNFLFGHVEQSKFMYVHKWRDFDLVLWDNRGKKRI